MKPYVFLYPRTRPSADRSWCSAPQSRTRTTPYTSLQHTTHAHGLLTPRVDIAETDTHFKLFVELAGVMKDDVQVTIHNNILTVRGKKLRPSEYEHMRFLSATRRFGILERSFKLGEDIDTENIHAEFSNGLLTLTLPKREQASSQTITIDIQ
ncbi:MAG: Hsp20/alpha crystallin family protein [Bacteroidota bacterium]|nr:Hsp20/alpha crystallin family protein [Candidatus Kapabacteria bacterium]MDW8219741.1 Hsp20/alpha crystallin family protein [Bacteroidota bacterium]